MGVLNLVLWGLGVVLIVVGYTRIRGPWNRYQTLKSQEANIARYERWRGGVRDSGRSGASVAMEEARRQGQLAGLIVLAGVVLVFLGFAIR